jgi:hypothetical protein
MAGVPTTDMPNMSEVIGQQQITDNRTFLAESAKEDTQDRWNRWNSEVANTWDFVGGTNQEYWDTFKKLYPGSNEDATGFMKSEVLSSFRGKTPEDQEMIFREKFRSWPMEMYDELETHFMNLKSANDAKDIERGIILHRLELNTRLEGEDYSKLDQQVPSEVHTNDWLRLYQRGHDAIDVDGNGRIGFAENGNITPSHTLGDEENPMEAEEQLIYHKYLKPLVKTKMSLANARARDNVARGEEEIAQLLAEDLINPVILDEHKINIIIDAASKSKDPLKETRRMINDVTTARMNHQGFVDERDLVRFRARQVKQIKQNVDRRLGNG